MKTWVAALLVLSVAYVAGEKGTGGGFTDVIKPPFTIDNPLATLLPPLEKDIRALIVAAVPKNKEVETAPILLVAYKSQVIAGVKYVVGTQVDTLNFVVTVIRPVSTGKAYVDKVVGPLVLGDPELLS